MSDTASNYTMIPNWIIRDSSLLGRELLVLVALHSRMGADRTAHPSRRVIAADTRTGEATVKRTIRDLEARGLISIEVRPRGDGTNMSNRYTLSELPWTRPTAGTRFFELVRPDVKVEEEGVTATPPGVSQTPPGDHGEPPGGSERTPQGVTATHEEDPLEEDPTEEDPGKKTSAYAVDFEHAWKHWPRSNDKARAYKSWQAALKKYPTADINAAIVLHGQTHKQVGTPTQFVPYLKTWLNGQGWAEPLPTPRHVEARKQPAFRRNLEVLAHFQQGEQTHGQARTLEAPNRSIGH